MVKTKNFKKNLGNGLLAGALALSLAVPTFAAVDTVQDIVQEDALARESDPYVSYDLNLYSGVPAYTTGGSNTTNVALITMSNLSDSRAKNVEVYSCSIMLCISQEGKREKLLFRQQNTHHRIYVQV